MTHERRKSDSVIVAEKPVNKADKLAVEQSAAELVKTNRRFVTWQPEQMKVWCSQPRHAPYRREPRSSGSTRRHTRCNASLTLRPALTRRAALVLGRYLTRLRLRPTRHVDRLGLRRSLVRC